MLQTELPAELAARLYSWAKEPYPPSVQGVEPWGGDDDGETRSDEPMILAEHAPVGSHWQRREAWAMGVMAMEAGRGQPAPEMFEREAAFPKVWAAAHDRQEEFSEELQGG